MNDTVALWLEVLSPFFYIGVGSLLPAVWQHLRGQPVQDDPAEEPELAQPAPQPAPSPSPLAEGRRWVIIGTPGSGKSAAARQIVRGFLDYGAKVVVLDPDGSAWPKGCKMVGAPDDYPAILAELRKITEIATERRAAFQRGQRHFEPLLIVLDEAPALLTNTPDAIGMITDLAQRGRKLSIHLIVVMQSTAAKLSGLQGYTALIRLMTKMEARRVGDTIQLIEADEVRQSFVLTPEHDLELPVTPTVSTTTDADRLLAKVLQEMPPAKTEKVVSLPEKPVSAPEKAGFGLPEAKEKAAVLVSTVAETGAPEAKKAANQPVMSGETTSAETVSAKEQPKEAPKEQPKETPQAPAAKTTESATETSSSNIHWPTIAKLVQAGVITQTEALRGLGLKPGSSKAYTEARDALKAALELDQTSELQLAQSEVITVK